MKKNNLGTSIVESLVVMLIIMIGVTGMYKIYTAGTNLAGTTNNRIQAIQIAREGIEALTNIRDTNWQVFTSDKENCWNTFNYNIDCIGDNSSDTDIQAGSYKVYKNSNNRWILEQTTPGAFGSGAYREEHKVTLDSQGFYSQSGGTILLPLFTREIKISYLDNSGIESANTNLEKMKIESIVQWKDSSGTNEHNVSIETVLTNWDK